MISLDLYGKQLASWLGLFDVAALIPRGWTLAGGQLVYMHVVARSTYDPRPTNDIDAIIDVRGMPGTPVQDFARALSMVGFDPVVGDMSGNTHRWIRGDATIDILIPRFLKHGTSDGTRSGGGRITTVSTAGGQFLLDRSVPVHVHTAQRDGVVNAPDLLGAMYGKASALLNVGDTHKQRHIEDLVLLASVADHRELQDVARLHTHQTERLLSGIAHAIAHQNTWDDSASIIRKAADFLSAARFVAQPDNDVNMEDILTVCPDVSPPAISMPPHRSRRRRCR